MTSSTNFFLFFAYFIVFVSLCCFVWHTFYERKKFLQKLSDEGFLN